MRPSQLADLLDVSGMTLRRWSDDFAAFLSPQASPGAGKDRAYQDHDQRVLLLVRTLRDNAVPLEGIRARLEQEQRDGYPNLPELPMGWGKDADETVSLAVAGARAGELATIAALQTELRAVSQQLEAAQQRVETLENELRDVRAAKDATEATLRDEKHALEQQQHDLEMQIERARGEVATLAARLEAYSLSYSFGRDKPVNVGVLLVVALLAGALLVTLAFVVARLVM